MSIYNKNKKVSENKNYGIYHNNKKIISVYSNNNLIYQYQSYKPNTEIITCINGQSANIELPIGVYSLYLTGGGGTGGVHYAGSGYFFTTSGGSGSTWEGTFYISKNTSIEVYGSGNNGDSYLNVNGTRMITAGGGRETSYLNSHPEGGTLNISSEWSPYIISTQKSTNGNNGTTSVAAIPAGGTTTSSLKWGEGDSVHTSGAVQYGGCKIIYLRYKK